MFPLIPLPIKEAIFHQEKLGTDFTHDAFPLIPLPIKEAIAIAKAIAVLPIAGFPLIPLPIKEAI